MKKDMKINLILFVALPFISALIGYFGVRVFIIPNQEISGKIAESEVVAVNEEKQTTTQSEEQSSEENTNEEEKKQITVEFDSIELYVIQMGAFSTNSNASSFVEQLNSKKIPSFVYEKRVYSFLGNDKSELEDELSIARQEIEDAFIKRISISPENLKIGEGDNKKATVEKIYNEMVNHLVRVISNEFEVASEIESLESITNLINALDLQNEDIGNKLTKISADFPKATNLEKIQSDSLSRHFYVVWFAEKIIQIN